MTDERARRISSRGLSESGGDFTHHEPRRAGVTSGNTEESLQLPSLSDPRARTIVIENVPEKDEETLVDRLENPRRGGGRMEHYERDKSNPENMRVVFAHQEVARRVLDMGCVKLSGVTLKIRLPSVVEGVQHPLPVGLVPTWTPRSPDLDSMSSMGSTESMDSMSDPNMKTVIVEDVPHNYEDTLNTALTNRERGGGRLLSYTRDTVDPRNMVAVFAHSKAARQILELKTLTVFDRKMSVRPPGDEQSLLSLDDLTNTFDTVKVYNVMPHISSELLVMYFENKKAGGGQIKSHVMKPEKKQAIIQFCNPAAARAVASKKTHHLANTWLSVVLLETALNKPCQAVRVSGIEWSKMTSEKLSLYFENRKHSGGGEILDLFVDQEDGEAVVTFASSDVAKEVLERNEKHGHTYEGISLKVKPMMPRSPPPCFLTDTEEKRLIIRGLRFRITLAKLSAFVQKYSKSKVTGWILGSKKNTAMLEFDSKPDYKALHQKVSCEPFYGHMISIQKVPVVTCALVSDIPPGVTTQSIVTYFEERIASPNSIAHEQKSENSVILEFPDHLVFTPLLSQPHTASGQTLNLKPYSRELECILPDRVSMDPPDNWVPRSLKIKVDFQKLQYIEKNISAKERTEEAFKTINCAVTWLSDASEPTVKLQQLDRQKSDADEKEWPVKCQELLKNLFDGIVSSTFRTSSEIWPRFFEMFQNESSNVFTIVDAEKYEVSLTGFTKEVREFKEKLKTIENEVKVKLEDEEELRNRKTDTLASLKPFQISYVRTGGVADEVKEKFSKVAINFEGQNVILEGKDDDLMNAKLFIFDAINKLDSKLVRMSELLTELISLEETKTHIHDCLCQKQIRAVIEASPEKNGVTVYGIGEEIDKASELLLSEFGETQFGMSDAIRHTVQLSGWSTTMRELKDAYKHLVVNHTSELFFSIACTKNHLEEVQNKLKEIFEKHNPVEEVISINPSHLNLMKTYKQTEIQSMRKQLTESTHGGTLKETLGNVPGYAIRGSKKEVESVKKQLETLAKNATETKLQLDQPGAQGLLRCTKGKQFLSDLQSKLSVACKTFITDSPFPATLKARPGVRYKTEIAPGHEVVLELVDITDILANALVNPTNSRLELTRGLGLEIVTLGGKEIEEECKVHVAMNGEVLPGNVYVSRSGSLPCQVIIHAVTPKVLDDSAIPKYQSSITKVLAEVNRQNFARVVFPLSFGVEFKRNTLFTTIREFFSQINTNNVKEILFCDDDAERLTQFEDQLKAFEESLKTGTANMPVPPPSQLTVPQLTLTTPEGILIVFYKGSICDIKAEAIVNSTARTLELNSGGVSKAILAAAGQGIQKECLAKAPKGLNQPGDILTTKGHNIPCCKNVYHGSAIQWDNGKGFCVKVLRIFISKALTQAHQDGMASIAIPAIGSGTLMVPHDIVISVLLEEIINFSKNYPATPVKTVYAVAYDKNQPSVDAFNKKFLALQAQYPTPLPAQAQGTQNFRQPKIPYSEKVVITITALSSSTAQKAQKEIVDFVKDSSENRNFEIGATLTKEQLQRIESLQPIHSVGISVQDSKIAISGLKDDVALAVEKIKFIVKDA